MNDHKDTYDVLICGGGPVGLVTAYGLQRMGIKTCVIERLEKSKMAMYGRAAGLYPRTLELLDQYDLLSRMVQVGFISRCVVNYDRNGNRDNTRGMRNVFDAMQGNTFIDYMLNIRLKYSEEIIQREYEKIGGVVLMGWALTKLATNSSGVKEEGCCVTIEVQNVSTSDTQTLTGNYLVGADGGRSTVRELSGISSTTASTTLRWVRIDGVAETSLPDSDIGFATLESASHGNAIWVRLDHGRSRVGFALSKAMLEKYGENLTQEQVIEEAKAAFRPFTLHFKCVDWYTSYSVRQSVADTFIRGRILLAGDACHAHSSGAAQGMNAGVHDAFNLTWKLAGVLKGWYQPSILKTYDSERRPIAQHIIELDKTFSALISGTIPAQFASSGTTDPNALLKRVGDESVHFNIGLGVKYTPNMLNVPTKSGGLPCAVRAPDVLVYAPGATSRIPTRLQSIMKNFGAFWVVVFAGEPLVTKLRVQKLREYVDGPAASSFLADRPSTEEASTVNGAGKATVRTEAEVKGTNAGERVKLLTIIAGIKNQADEALGVPRFGDAYYDHDSTAHIRYGVSLDEGAVIVVRPDGILAYATKLDCGRDLGEYFERFMR